MLLFWIGVLVWVWWVLCCGVFVVFFVDVVWVVCGVDL